MRIFSYLLLNLFFQCFHLEQKYFQKKFEFFNTQYNFINEDRYISINERFSYSFSHTIKSGIICFVICLAIESILNYFFFNSKNKIIKLQKYLNKNNKESILIKLNNYYKKYYLIILSINLIIIIFECYTIINFTQIYNGGFSDLLGGMFWTFLFLQIFPFIYSIIFAFIIKIGMNDERQYLIKITELIYF